jgi:hypothetical protein
MDKNNLRCFYIILISLVYLIILYYAANNRNKKVWTIPKSEIIQTYFNNNDSREIYNISFVKHNNKLKLIARSEIKNIIYGLVSLDNEIITGEVTDLTQINSVKWKSVKFNISDYSHNEDSRLFVINNRLFSINTNKKLIYNNSFIKWLYKNKFCLIPWTDTKICIAEHDEEMNVINFKRFQEFDGVQKNWSLFSSDGIDYLVTDFFPFTYYKIDINTFEISNKTIINHTNKYNDKINFRACRIFETKNNKHKCICNLLIGNRLNRLYCFQFFEIDLTNKTINPLSDLFSYHDSDDILNNIKKFSYPHHINYIDNDLILSLSKDDRYNIFYKIYVDNFS